VNQDYVQAVKWYRLAAEQGDAVGAYGLGIRYIEGQGIPQDNAQAEKWFKVAAEAGHGDAAYNLAIIYQNKNDRTSEVKYLQIASDQGIADGQCLLGQMYAEGLALPKDQIAAYEWATLAIKNGALACQKVIDALQKSKMSSADIAEAKRRADAWQPKAHPGFNY